MIKAFICFIDDKGDRHSIPYEIFPSGLSKKWIDLVLENQKNESSYLHTGFFNETASGIPKIHSELMNLVKEINYEYKILFPKFKNNQYSNILPVYEDSPLNTEQLNTLHALFEDWGDNIPVLEFKKIHSSSVKNKFLILNELIHSYENALRHAATGKFPAMSANIDYYPTGIHGVIDPVDKLYVTNQYDWGYLYLGYNTLGKDWMTVAMDNDLEVVSRGTVRPQERFAAELWVSFVNYHQQWGTAHTFESWYNSLDASTRSRVPIDNLSNLVLGKFLLGRVYIDEYYFLKFDPEINNWLIPNSQARSNWNTNVFSTFVKVDRIDILT